MEEKVNVRQNEKIDESQSLQCIRSQLAGAGKGHSAFSAGLLTAFTTFRIADKVRRSIPTVKGVFLERVTFTYPRYAQGLPCFDTERCEQCEDVICGYKIAD